MLALKTDRLELVRWDAERFSDSYVEICGDPEVMRYVGAGVPLTEEKARAASARMSNHWEEYGFGFWGVFGDWSEELLGFVGLAHPLWCPGYESTVEVGWRLRQSAWGRGVATEGAREALRVGFEELDLEEILAFVHPDNERSINVTRKLGLTYSESTHDPDFNGEVKVFRIAAPLPS